MNEITWLHLKQQSLLTLNFKSKLFLQGWGLTSEVICPGKGRGNRLFSPRSETPALTAVGQSWKHSLLPLLFLSALISQLHGSARFSPGSLCWALLNHHFPYLGFILAGPSIPIGHLDACLSQDILGSQNNKQQESKIKPNSGAHKLAP